LDLSGVLARNGEEIATRKRWTEEEYNKLIELVEKHAISSLHN
jgi:hypothetical protein